MRHVDGLRPSVESNSISINNTVTNGIVSVYQRGIFLYMRLYMIYIIPELNVGTTTLTNEHIAEYS